MHASSYRHTNVPLAGKELSTAILRLMRAVTLNDPKPTQAGGDVVCRSRSWLLPCRAVVSIMGIVYLSLLKLPLAGPILQLLYVFKQC